MASGVALVFEDIRTAIHHRARGNPTDLTRVLSADRTTRARHDPVPRMLSDEHPRWVAGQNWPATGPDHSAVDLLGVGRGQHRPPRRTRAGRPRAARGDSLVHCDLYPQTFCLIAQQVVFVDCRTLGWGRPPSMP